MAIEDGGVMDEFDGEWGFKPAGKKRPIMVVLLGTWVTVELRERLREAARNSGKSFADEVEGRLLASFEADERRGE